MMIQPNAIFWTFGKVGSMASQNMIIKPKAKKQINATIPKISKNRLAGDFCRLLPVNMFKCY